jgi:hypothetical protein
MRLAALVVVVLSLAPAVAHAEANDAADQDAWLAALGDRVVEDLAAGRPLVVQIHAPLCEASILRCGNARLGDGDNPASNLYWSTTPGFGAWFKRRGGGWKKLVDQAAGDTYDPDVLAQVVYRRTIRTPRAWRERGAPERYPLYLVVAGWRGSAIDRALAAYARELSGQGARTIALGDGTTIDAGGAAQLVVYSGHNRLMDVDHFDWPAPAERPIGTIAIACLTQDYMADDVPAPTRVPLLMTRDFLFANAAPVEGAVLAFARGGDYRAIRRAAAAAYAGVQGKAVSRVIGAFTNPGDRRWRTRR